MLDGQSFAEVPVPNDSVLELGRDNRNFSVSFWIYPEDTGSGTWRQVFYKGSDAGGITAFGLWLHPSSNRVKFRTKTESQEVSDCDSSNEIETKRWTHICCVNLNRQMQLWIDGNLESKLALQSAVVPTPGNFYIGTSPNAASFNGGLDETRVYGFSLDAEAVMHLATDRRMALSEEPLADYHQTAYEALLRGYGTSLEELRGLNSLSGDQRRALAERLGLLAANQTSDNLDTLIPNFVSGTDVFEQWLSGTFGLPLTFTPALPPANPGYAFLSWARRSSLGDRWSVEDAQRLGVPDLDPDIVDLADLSPNATEWRVLHRSRHAELSVRFNQFNTLLGQTRLAEAIGEVFSTDELNELRQLAARERAGESIADELPRFKLDSTMFRRLLTYLDRLTVTPTILEREDLAHLLTQLRKLRQRYEPWQQQEAQLSTRLWPTTTAEAAWVPGSYKGDFLPWRGSAQQRADLESRIGNRLQAWQAIQDAQDNAVTEAQRVSLPLLRDGLLGISDLPAAQPLLDDLSERWLVDFGTNSATFLTPVDQAIGSLQTLINGIRGNWFEVGHTANGWEISGPAPDFEEQWGWLNNYGRWQTAVLNYLYPENVLYPELRGFNTPEFETFLAVLAKLQPISVDALTRPNTDFAAALDKLADSQFIGPPPGLLTNTWEKSFFAPVAIALAFQRTGLYMSALDWYRKVYDSSQSTPATRKLVPPIKGERDDIPPKAAFGDGWTGALDDPHTIVAAQKSGCGNPYTRFVLFQILQCLLAQADDAFAKSTRDSRALALALYLEIHDILGFEELQDLQPASPLEAYLPSPVLSSYRAHAASALKKLRRGLSFLGTPMPPDLTRGAGGGAVSSLVRPTPYRFRVLLERAKQLITQSQQLESQYLSALERKDGETEKLITAGFGVENARQTIGLRTLQETEASHGKELAIRQQARSRIQRDRYSNWISDGPNTHERAQIDHMWESTWAKDFLAAARGAVTVGNVAVSVAGVEDIISFGAVKGGKIAAISVAAGIEAGAQSLVNHLENAVQVEGIYASQERRMQEWWLQRDLADQDGRIGETQLTLALDRIAIAQQESRIANTQLTQAQQMLAFHGSKFTSVRFYGWFAGELAQFYATFLRLATVTAQHAELQIAFERQEQPARLIKSDYWQLASKSAAAASTSSSGQGASAPALEAKGITGSARLLQDIYALDEYAFSSERRLLNLTQSFSVARLMPIEFEEFRRTGALTIATPMSWFDEGFPGHYLRLVKKVRVSVAALIPPSVGIRATLENSGMSRVVTSDPGYPTVVIQQPRQLVALTSPTGSSGVFELDAQSELLYPFEGSGVETTWFLELSPAGNPFDFDSLMDVVLTIDYTALHSQEVRDRVVKQMPRRSSGVRTFSVKRDLPDLWYELTNSSSTTVAVKLPFGKRSFPPGLSELAISVASLSIRSMAGAPSDFAASLRISGTNNVPANYPSIWGIVSSRQAGVRWLDSSWPIPETPVDWIFSLSAKPGSGATGEPSFLTQLRNGEIDDILVVTTFSGLRPAWL